MFILEFGFLLTARVKSTWMSSFSTSKMLSEMSARISTQPENPALRIRRYSVEWGLLIPTWHSMPMAFLLAIRRVQVCWLTVFSEKLLFKFFHLSNRIITFIFTHYLYNMVHCFLFYAKKRMMVPAFRGLNLEVNKQNIYVV